MKTWKHAQMRAHTASMLNKLLSEMQVMIGNQIVHEAHIIFRDNNVNNFVNVLFDAAVEEAMERMRPQPEETTNELPSQQGQ
jgi:predicted YcjX-like family ATPase